MARTYAQLQMELLQTTQQTKYLKNHISKLREDLLKSRSFQKHLIESYEQVVKEWRISYNDLINNTWKLVFVRLRRKIKGV
jgi:hypothetical protein